MAYSNVTPPTLPDYNPVSGYSYNGVELPDINTVWTDKEMYPYAAIALAGGVYHLNLYTFLSNTDGAYVYCTEAGSVLDYSFTDGQWELTEEREVSAGETLVSLSYISMAWTSADCLYTDGTLYLAASEPVPIQPYPYSVIAYNYEKGAEDWYQAHLCYSATPFTWNGTAVVNSGTTYKRIYDAELDAWTDEAETEIEATPGLDGTVYQRIYTDHDILDSTGAVWLAAGNITHVGMSEEWLYSFKLGLALGLCGKPLPIVRKLIGYSYNGTVLPKLPEWDKETYPYAAIVAMNATDYPYALYCAKQAFVIADGKLNFATADIHTPLRYEYYINSSEWTGGENIFVQTGLGVDGTAVWSNHDLLDKKDGTIILAASEPVPIYE